MRRATIAKMQPTIRLSAPERFFFTHAGWSYDPLTETPAEGRTRCAIALCAAEAVLHAAMQGDEGSATVEWDEDADAWADYRADKRAGHSEEPDSIEDACIFIGDKLVAYLGAIEGPDANYRRVIEAELALECAAQLARAVVLTAV